MVMVPPLVTVAPEPMASVAVALSVAVPSLTSVPPLTVVEDEVVVSQVAPLATVTGTLTTNGGNFEGPGTVTDDPGLRFRVAADRSSVPEDSWIEPVLSTARLPPYRVAVPVEPGLTTRVPVLSKVVLVL